MSARRTQRELRPWVRRPGWAVVLVTLLAADLGLGLHFTALAAQAASAGQTASSVTVRWSDSERNTDIPGSDAFANFTVTVNQTVDLVSQGVEVRWSGLRETNPSEFGRDYVQIMQCWSPKGSPVRPETCQFGAPSSTFAGLMGVNAANRSLIEGEDPEQVYGPDQLIPPPRSNPNLRAFGIPFISARGGQSFTVADYFTSATTNEVSAARTGADGTGSAIIELQTSLEAPHLGCGAPLAVGSAELARDCWLVVVPRGDLNLDGSPFTRDPGSRITGSPLSASAWAQRVEIPLVFEPVGLSCALGQAERRTVGTELIAEAMTSWQNALCAAGTTYGYSQIGDEEARRQLLSTTPGAAGLAFVGEPISPSQLTEGTSVLYAPVAVSALTVGFTIDYFVATNSPVGPRNGTLLADIVLNQRLVAKLLTQSYRADVPNGNAVPAVAQNPRSLRHDPEFIALNPEFQFFSQQAEPEGLMVALGSSDANKALWSWVLSDPDARAFLDGTPDPWGARVNPYYFDLDLDADPVDTFPKADLTTYRQFPSIPEPGYGTLNMRPYMNDMLEGALRTRRADAGARVVWDDTRVPPSFVSGGPQVPGRRFAMSVVDTPSASRYAIGTARLVNAAGEALGPNQDALLSALNGMTAGAQPGTLANSADRKVKGAYPLTLPTYAAVNLCSTDLDALADYANLIEFAVGPGQRPGEARGSLPAGYLPLPSALVEQALETVAAIRAEVTKPECKEHQPSAEEPTPTPTPTPDDLGGDFGEDFTDPDIDFGGFVPDEASADEDATPTPVTPSPPSDVEAVLTGTAGWSAAQYGIAGAALFGLPCILSGPILLRRGAVAL